MHLSRGWLPGRERGRVWGSKKEDGGRGDVDAGKDEEERQEPLEQLRRPCRALQGRDGGLWVAGEGRGD